MTPEDVLGILLGGGEIARCCLGVSERQHDEEHTGFSAKAQE